MITPWKIGLGCNIHQTYGANGKIRWCSCLIAHMEKTNA